MSSYLTNRNYNTLNGDSNKQLKIFQYETTSKKTFTPPASYYLAGEMKSEKFNSRFLAYMQIHCLQPGSCGHKKQYVQDANCLEVSGIIKKWHWSMSSELFIWVE